MSYPKNYKYTKDHEWIEILPNKKARVGVTSYAVEQLGDIVHMDLPKVGIQVKSGDSFGTIESTKTVSDLYMPVTSKITAVNDALTKTPESLQTDSYKWLVEIEVEDENEFKSLLDADAYEKFVSEG